MPGRSTRTAKLDLQLSPDAKQRLQSAAELGKRLDCGWKIPYNRAFRWMIPDFVVICSRRPIMSLSHLTAEEAELAERIYQTLRQAADSDLRSLAELLASKPDRQLLGQTEFEVRDRVHKIGAKAFETALEERKKGGIKGPQ